MSEPDQRGQPDRLPAPALLAVRGGPSDEELAALVSVLAALAARRPAGPPPGSQWRNRARSIRPAMGPGPGAWRASGLPR